MLEHPLTRVSAPDSHLYNQSLDWEIDLSRPVALQDRRLSIPILLTSPSPTCPACYLPMNPYGSCQGQQTYADVPLGRFTRRLVFTRNRYICRTVDCSQKGKTLLHPLPKSFMKGQGAPKITRELYRFIIRELCKLPHTTVANLVGLDEKTIRDLLDYHFARFCYLPSLETPEWMGIDDLHLGPRGRKQRIVTVISNIKDHRLCEIVETPKVTRATTNSKELPPERAYNQPKQFDLSRLEHYLATLDQPESVKVVCIDCSDVYRPVIKKFLGNATLVVDKFHAMQLADKPFFEINKMKPSPRPTQKTKERQLELLPSLEAQTLSLAIPTREKKTAKERSSRKSVLNNRHIYTPATKLELKDRQYVDEVFATYPRVKDAYHCRLEFRAIWDETGTRERLYHESTSDYLDLRKPGRLLTTDEKLALDEFYHDPPLFRRDRTVASPKDMAVLRFLHWEKNIPNSVRRKFKKVADTVRNWAHPIFAYFEIDHSLLDKPFTGETNSPPSSTPSTRATNGYTEALNRLIRIEERFSYARGPEKLRLRVMQLYSIYAHLPDLHLDSSDIQDTLQKIQARRQKMPRILTEKHRLEAGIPRIVKEPMDSEIPF